ncbi:hypothetical protein [Mycobacterium sp. HUMS_1102779]|uniref:hypothetical protein n=1 Tax=Mycobacterium sp. HUMS_1102779 TaxID=3383487 RepID=UPI00389B20BD
MVVLFGVHRTGARPTIRDGFLGRVAGDDSTACLLRSGLERQRKILSCRDDETAQGRHSERGRFLGERGAGGVAHAGAAAKVSSACSTGGDARSSRMWFKNLRSDRVRDERLGAVARFDESPQPALQLRDQIRLPRNGFLQPHDPIRLPPLQSGKLLTGRTRVGEHRDEVRESRCNPGRHAQHNRHRPLTSSRIR